VNSKIPKPKDGLRSKIQPHKKLSPNFPKHPTMNTRKQLPEPLKLSRPGAEPPFSPDRDSCWNSKPKSEKIWIF
jgi:hypothetical protein